LQSCWRRDPGRNGGGKHALRTGWQAPEWSILAALNSSVEGLRITDGDLPPFYLNQILCLEPAEIARDELADCSDPCRQFLIGRRKHNFDAHRVRHASYPVLIELWRGYRDSALAEACSAAKVGMEEVAEALERPRAKSIDRDWQAASLGELARHIVEKHHGFTKREIQRLVTLIAKVVSVHGANHVELEQVQSLFCGLAQEMTMHMMKEEHMLFPYIEQLELAVNKGCQPAPPMFGTVQNPVRMMMMEHDSAGQSLRTMREVTKGYVLPADACASYKMLYSALQEFEADLHQHIHLENNILFPRAVEMETLGG
jgi:regulator of cell morphogenesis and NO signaling